MLFWIFALFLFITLADIALTIVSTNLGGLEHGALYLLSNDLPLTLFIKGITSFLLGLIFMCYKRRDLLIISCSVIGGVCLWNGYLVARAFT